MTRQVKYNPQDNKFLPKNKNLSVMHAFETAVLLMEQAGVTEEDIMKYVHMVHMGWIRDGALSPEYVELCQQVQKQQREEAAMQERLRLLRESAVSNVITDHRS